jgi:Fuc2NAc and GlcNAc transferase
LGLIHYNTIALFALIAFTFLGAQLGLRFFFRFALEHRVFIDVPTERSAHRIPTVRGAGIVFAWITLVSIAVLETVFATQYLTALLWSVFIIALLGFCDDYRGLGVGVRLVVQTIAAGIFVATIPAPDFLLRIHPLLEYVWWPLSVGFLLACTNFYNFLDGLDGLLAGHVVSLCGVWVMICTCSVGALALGPESILCVILSVALLAFLMGNWHPAKYFMGDAGSTFLGFLLGAFALISIPGLPRTGNFSALCLLMFPVLFDGAFTLLSRVLRGESWRTPHKEHLFQRLFRAGLSPKQVSLSYMGITFLTGLLLCLLSLGLQLPVIFWVFLFVLPYLLLYGLVFRLEKRNSYRQFRSEKFSSPEILAS